VRYVFNSSHVASTHSVVAPGDRKDQTGVDWFEKRERFRGEIDGEGLALLREK
jgi:hypothetical protein